MFKSLKYGQNKVVLAALYFLIAVLVWLDVAGDFEITGLSWHIGIEVLIGLLSTWVFGTLVYTRSQTQASLVKTNERLVESESKNLSFQNEAEKWKKESRILIEGLSKSIDQQFQSWHFSPAERDVALLLVKGLSTKEISVIRNTSEKTIRAQSHSIYTKSNLSGRNELAAFFLESWFELRNR